MNQGDLEQLIQIRTGRLAQMDGQREFVATRALGLLAFAGAISTVGALVVPALDGLYQTLAAWLIGLLLLVGFFTAVYSIRAQQVAGWLRPTIRVCNLGPAGSLRPDSLPGDAKLVYAADVILAEQANQRHLDLACLALGRAHRLALCSIILVSALAVLALVSGGRPTTTPSPGASGSSLPTGPATSSRYQGPAMTTGRGTQPALVLAA